MTTWNGTTDPDARSVPLDALTPHERNYNRHPAAQIERLQASLREFGQPRPIVVHRGVILAGHGVYMAAKASGWSNIWCSVVPDAWTPERAQAYLVADNETRRGAEPEAEVLAELVEAARQEVDLAALGFDGAGLDALLADLGTSEAAPPVHTIKGHSDGYDFREINVKKLAYRIEAAWRAGDGVAVDLFSGHGQLAFWYARRFVQVVRVNREHYDGIDYVLTAESFLRSDVFPAGTFTFIDLDDEGSPLREVRTLFDVLPAERVMPFVLCVTDGSGLNLKLHGRIDPSLYALDEDQRRATTADFHVFPDLVAGAVRQIANEHGWAAALWSSERGSDNNVVYQTFLVSREQ
jgi:hypothetical protein